MRSQSGKLFWVMLIIISFIAVATSAKAGQADKTVKIDKVVKKELIVPDKQIEKIEQKETAKDDIAVVNGVGIKQEDYDREFIGIQEQYSSRGEKLEDKDLADIKKKILEKLIDLQLLYQESQKKGYKIEDSTVEEQLAKFKEQFPSVDEFNKEMARVKFTEASLKNQIKQGMAIQQYVNKEIADKITVSVDEIKNFFETHLKERIEKSIKQEKVQNEVAKYLDQLKNKSEVKRNL